MLHAHFPFRRNYEELVSQGRLWEQSGEHKHAIDTYLQLNTQNCPDKEILQEYWDKVRVLGRFHHDLVMHAARV